MKKLLMLAGWLVSMVTALQATQQFYINTSPINACCTVGYCQDLPPTIDAFNFVNRSVFNVSIYDCNYFVSAPYEMLNVWWFTNTPSASIYGNPGFRFDYFTGNNRSKMGNWMNYGAVTGETWIAVSAHNITSTGPLVTGPSGLIRLDGDNISLVRDGLRSGQTPNTYYYGGYTIGTNYYNAPGISDLWWGCGTNNYLNGSNAPMILDGGNFDVPCSQSPLHQVIYQSLFGYTYTNLVAVPMFQYFFFTNCYVPYNAYVYYSQIGTTKRYQIAYVPQNLGDTNFNTVVRFYPRFTGDAADVVVAFEMVETDIVSLTRTTNALYLVDHAGFETNVFFARPSLRGATGRRPNNYELFRYPPFEYTYGIGPNMPFTNTIIYNPSYVTNRVNMMYAGYAAQLASGNAAFTNYYTTAGDPTNYPGRIEISGGNLNLDQTRIRAESTLLIRAQTNLVNNKLPRVDALFCSYDLHTRQSPLFITNLAPRTVTRLSGDIYAWTGVWDNYEVVGTSTNRVQIHVLIVDSALASAQPVSIFELFVQSTNIVLCDPLSVTRAIELDASSLHVRSDLNLPYGGGWGATNVPKLVHFTNDGIISIPGAARYGTDRSYGYTNFINRGTNTAAAQSIQTVNFENMGSGLVASSGGLLSLQAKSIKMLGNPNVYFNAWYTNVWTNWWLGTVVTNITNIDITNSIGPRLMANSDIQINAGDMFVSNSIIQAGESSMGALILAVTNNLVNGGPAINEWVASAGFQMLIQPTNSDLLFTHITSKAARFLEIPHTWNAQNRGASTNWGFTNNLALGKLTLDGEPQCLFRFSAPSGLNNRAMYIDYLELLNEATNHVDSLYIETNFTIYVANANIPPRKLEITHPGRIRWVPYFQGPLSTTNMLYPSGRTYSFNIALVTDKDLDSDGDGTPNAYDPTPIFVNESFGLDINLLPGSPPKSVVSWTSLARTTNWLETKKPLATNWSPLATVVSGPARARLAVTNSMSSDSLRFYRVRIPTPPPY